MKCVVLLLLCFSGTAFAEPPFSKSAFVDSAKLIRSSLPYSDLMSRLEALHQQHKKDLEDTEISLQETYKNLIENRDNLSSQEFETKMKAYQNSAESFQEHALKLKTTYEGLKEAELKKITRNAERLSQELLQQRKYEVIFNKDAIYLNSNLVDITDLLLERLNRDFLQVKLESKK